MFSFDIEFVKKLKKQDHNAFNQFYLKTIDIFFRYINWNYTVSQQDCNEVIWDFYLKIWEALKKIDESQNFSVYVWTIFKNTLKDYFKKMSDIPFTNMNSEDPEAQTFEELLEDETDFTEFLESNYKFEQIQEAMMKLDWLSRDVVYFKFVEEKDYDEISKLTGLSNENVRQKLSRAIKKIKEILAVWTTD